MDQPHEQKLITLTPEQLTELCVRFAVFMGWTPGPTSAEWLMDVKKKGARFKYEEMTGAREMAVILTADEGVTTSLESLKKLEAVDLG
jgi:hypothetical protein